MKYFTAERHVVARYTEALINYFQVQYKARNSLMFLNIGQVVIINGGLFVVMFMAANEVMSGTKLGILCIFISF